MTENTAGGPPADAGGTPQKDDSDATDTAAEAGSESPEEGAAAMAAAEDAIVDEDGAG